MKTRLFVLALIALIYLSGTTLMAQEPPPISELDAVVTDTPPAKKAKPDKPVVKAKDVPPHNIQEMEDFYDYCIEDSYLKKSFDCRCLAVEYLDQRMTKGPSINSSDIINSLEKQRCAYEPDTDMSEPDVDLSNVSDKDLNEAQDVYNDCEQDGNMKRSYDCECLSVKYLNERIKRGQTATRSGIMLDLVRTCRNIEGTAGYIYSECHRQAVSMPIWQPLDEFCTCYANTFAKLFEKSRVIPGTQRYVSLRSQAMGMCRIFPNGIQNPHNPRR